MLALVAIGVLVAAFVLFRLGMKLLSGVLALVIGAAILVVVLFGHSYRISSTSMEPALARGDRVLALRVGSPGPGTMVAFRPPSGGPDGRCGAAAGPHRLCARPTTGLARTTFFARIVAVGGDRVGMPDGRLVRNGRRVKEPYAQRCTVSAACRFTGTIRIPSGDVFVLKDDREAGLDSREFGPVPRSAVSGRIVLRYWPLSGLGTP